jgi:16S rRNA (guanine527-N7)-methyltransferase
MSEGLEPRLRRGLDELGLSLSDAQIQTLLAYQGWVAKWNKVYNLTAVREPQEMLTHHLLDSLAVIVPLRRQLGAGPLKLLDVGAGAGLPGVVIAIVCPQVQVICVDTVAKKALFIQQVAAALRLTNLQGLHARVENVSEAFDVVTSRAFASLSDFTQWSAQALAPQGVWMALKGKTPTDEMQALPGQVDVFHVEQLQVPGLNAERCLVWMRKAGLNLGHNAG